MRHTLLIIGCALAAFADRLCGRGLAVNEAPAAPIPGTLPSDTPVVTVGIPTNLDPNKILARKKALIAAGTEPLLAEKLAIDAEQQQWLRDNELSVSATVEQRPVTENVLVIKTHPDGEPEEVNLESLSVAKLTELAETNSYDLKGATKKADIIKAILGAAKASIIALCCALFFGAAAPAKASVDSIPVAAAVSAAPALTSTLDVGRWALDVPPAPLASFLAYLQLDAQEWTEAISATVCAIAACAWLPRRYRSWGAHFRYLVERARERISSKWRRALFRIGMLFARVEHLLSGRALATNVTFTPQQTSHGTASYDATAAIAFKNAVVCRGADDRHFKLGTLVTDVPLGILFNDEVDSGDADVVKKVVGIFGLYPESLPFVHAAACAVDALMVIDLATPGRMKALPVAAGTYLVCGRNRYTAAAAGDPGSLAHCVPYTVVVP
jgi:hypothetical protein